MWRVRSRVARETQLSIYLGLAVLRVPPVDELALRDLAVAVLVEQLELGLQVKGVLNQ